MKMKDKTKDGIKELIKEIAFGMLTENVSYNINFKSKKFKVIFDVNENPTKKGIKVQFTPYENMILKPQEARQFINDLQVYLNQKWGQIGINVDFDPDVPYKNVVGFTIKLGDVANTLINALKNDGGETPNTSSITHNDKSVLDNEKKI